MFWCFDGGPPELAQLNLDNVVNNTGNNNTGNNNNDDNDDDDDDNDDDNDDDDDDDADDYSVFCSINNGCVQTVGWNRKLLKIHPYKLSTKLLMSNVRIIVLFFL